MSVADLTARLTAAIASFERGDRQAVLDGEVWDAAAELQRLAAADGGLVERLRACRYRYAAELLRATVDADDAAGLTLAIDLLEIAVHEAPDAADLAARWSNLGAGLQLRFKRAGRIEDLDRAVEAGFAAVAATPADDLRLAARRSNLSAALQNRFKRTGDRADLDDAVDLGSQAVGITPAGSPHLGSMLATLGAALQLRHECAGALADLDRAIAVGHRAVEASPPAGARRAGRLSSLGAALVTRFHHLGVPADLDRAVDLGRQAVDATPAGHPDLGAMLSNLGNTLQTRSESFGSSTDLRQAVDAARLAVEQCGTGDPRLAVRLSNFGGVLRAWLRRVGAVTGPPDGATGLRRPVLPGAPFAVDPIAGVDVTARVVRIAAPEHPQWPMFLSSHSNALADRFERGGAVEDLHQSVTFARYALAATLAGHPHHPRYLSNLGLRLQARFAGTADPADVAEAVRLAWAAVTGTPPEHPARAGRLIGLGAALHARFAAAGAVADLDGALSAWEDAVAAVSAPVDVRLDAARRLAEAAARAGRTEESADAAAAAAGLLPMLAWRGISRGDQYFLLSREAAAVGRDAGASALAADRSGRAVELLEQGRGVLWTQLLDSRTDLGALRRSRPALAAALAACRIRLDRPSEDGAAGG
ncbi:tetratricopeptide repeat protein [Dactylosporangium sp. NPDC005555]|uniref:tetratricopeptide repeat protein n=1 Tax=Dactylosporangium sp. NPDC005555 TaxID=3154889 RepID=UPI0033B11D9D